MDLSIQLVSVGDVVKVGVLLVGIGYSLLQRIFGRLVVQARKAYRPARFYRSP